MSQRWRSVFWLSQMFPGSKKMDSSSVCRGGLYKHSIGSPCVCVYVFVCMCVCVYGYGYGYVYVFVFVFVLSW